MITQFQRKEGRGRDVANSANFRDFTRKLKKKNLLRKAKKFTEIMSKQNLINKECRISFDKYFFLKNLYASTLVLGDIQLT